jgi:thiol-disulfide isomerase/thioredoxin
VDSILQVLGKKLYTKELQFIRQRPDQYFSMYVFRSWLSRTPYIDTDTLLNIYNTVFPDSLRECFDGKEALKHLEARINARKGMKAPDYTTKEISGKIISPAVNSGKFVLLDFWASWCGPCVASMPVIKKLRASYGNHKLEIISISLDTHRDQFEAALKEHGMTWTQVFGEPEVVKLYNVGAIPSIFLIDPDGKIVYDYLKEKDEMGLKKLTGLLRAALGTGGRQGNE